MQFEDIYATRRSRARDSQRSKVYAAEQVLRSGPGLTPAETQRFVDKVQQSPYTVRKYGARVSPLVLDSRRRRFAVAKWTGEIDLSASWARRKDVVLHELAHHYAGLREGHGWKFCEVYLDLVRHFLGKEQADALKSSFKRHKVKFTAPRAKATRTPAQIAAAAAGAERLAAARAARQGASGRFGILVEDQWGRKLVKGLDSVGRVTHVTSYPSRAREWKTQAGVTGALAKLQARQNQTFGAARSTGEFTKLVVDLDTLDEITYSTLGGSDVLRAVVRF